MPPTINYDGEFPSTTQNFASERADYESGSGDDDYHHHQVSMHQQMPGVTSKSVPPAYTQQAPYSPSVGVYQPATYGEPAPSHLQPTMHYTSIPTPSGVINHNQQYPSQTVFPNPPVQRHPSHPDSPDHYEQDQYGQQNLADLLGDLRMDETGTGSFSITHNLR